MSGISSRLSRCTATMRTKRATWFADKEGHVRGGDPWTGPAAFSLPPGRGGVRGDRALPHGPRSLSTSRQCTPRASRGRRTLGRATCGGAGPSAPREPAGRAPLPTRPCPVVGTMPMGRHPAAPPGPSWHRGRRRWAQRDRLALDSRVTPRALGHLIDRIVHSIESSAANAMLLLTESRNCNIRGQQSVMDVRDVCPACRSQRFKKNGHNHDGKPTGSCWIPGSWICRGRTTPIVVTLSSWKPFFFHGLQEGGALLGPWWSLRPRNPRRACGVWANV